MANISLSVPERTNLTLIKPWLEADRHYRDRRHRFYVGAGYAAAQSMYRTAIPKMWESFQQYNSINRHHTKDQHLVLKTGRLALESVALARVAYVHGKVASGLSIEQAHVASFKGIEFFQRAIKTGAVALPASELLDVPLPDALRSYTGHKAAESNAQHAYMGLVGLTVRALSDMQPRRRASEMIIPEPGTAHDAALEAWNVESHLAQASRLG